MQVRSSLTFLVTFQLQYVLILLILPFILSLCNCCHHIDHASLSSFKLAFDDQPLPPLNWSIAIDCCQWEGISCDQEGRVSRLWLPSRGLGGYISPSITNLTHLSHLNLSNSYTGQRSLFYGYLPEHLFASLERLQVLDLSNNALMGHFPLLVQSMSIHIVDVSNNLFFGPIVVPPQFFAPNLTSFSVRNNEFSGKLPASLCVNSSLTFVDISLNNFTEEIPGALAECSKLTVLKGGNNSLSGSLPDFIFNITTLTSLDLSANKLSGPLFEGVGNLIYLEKLDLSKNNLNGFLPASLAKCARLQEINLGFNNLSGDLARINFSSLPQLHSLDLSNNHFKGEFPHSLYLCKSLSKIHLGHNQLAGQLLPSIASMPSLTELSLHHNALTNFTAAIQILMQCKGLRVLVLSYNFFGENVHDTDMLMHSGFQNLQVLGLSGCQLSMLPTWLTKMPSLQAIDFSFNNIIGPIPTWLGSLPSLLYIDLSSNFISGNIPPELCHLQAIRSDDGFTGCSYVLDGFHNNEHGMCISAIYLANNSLVGSIPTEIDQLQSLLALDLSHNKLTGHIPEEILNLYHLWVLDLSFNDLSGRIPDSEDKQWSVQVLNVSYNNLEGPIPRSGPFSTYDALSFQGNPRLCGYFLIKRPDCSEQEEIMKTEKKKRLEVPWFHIDVALGYCTGFFAVCYSLLFCTAWRNAYFSFLTHLKDQVLGFIAMKVGRLRQDYGS